jgi:hypothetical protein
MKSKLIAFVLAKAPGVKKGEMLEVHPSQSAPHYFEATVPHQYIIGQEKLTLSTKSGDREIDFLIKSYLPDVLLVEVSVDVSDVFSEETFDLRQALIDNCHEILKKQGGDYEMSEEYSLIIVSDYKGDPEQFLNKAPEIVGFLKSEKMPLDEEEIKHVIETKQLKYGKDDLLIIGWDGAFVADPLGEYEADKELFQIANLQLLRYRILDQDLSERLQKVSKLIQKAPETRVFIWSTKELAKSFKEVIRVRSQSLSQFEIIDREIKLIGDWYSARFYEMLSAMFRINDWKLSIKNKLNSLEDVYNIVSQNFSITRHQVLELIQIIMFFILQAGWFILIILEFGYFLKD